MIYDRYILITTAKLERMTLIDNVVGILNVNLDFTSATISSFDIVTCDKEALEDYLNNNSIEYKIFSITRPSTDEILDKINNTGERNYYDEIFMRSNTIEEEYIRMGVLKKLK
jgi:hypothetical protein